MKRLIVKNIQNCTGCGSCERACAKAYYKTEDREYSCIRIMDAQIRVCTCLLYTSNSRPFYGEADGDLTAVRIALGR